MGVYSFCNLWFVCSDGIILLVYNFDDLKRLVFDYFVVGDCV